MVRPAIFFPKGHGEPGRPDRPLLSPFESDARRMLNPPEPYKGGLVTKGELACGQAKAILERVAFPLRPALAL
jgi:hypothetical protein